MKTYRYQVITIDDKCPIKTYQSLSGAKRFIERLVSMDKEKVKIIEIGSWKKVEVKVKKYER